VFYRYVCVLQEVRARHKVHISCMKAAWTEGNRNVVLTLYDSYTRAKVIRKTLSSEALKAFKVDSTMTPQVHVFLIKRVNLYF